MSRLHQICQGFELFLSAMLCNDFMGGYAFPLCPSDFMYLRGWCSLFALDKFQVCPLCSSYMLYLDSQGLHSIRRHLQHPYPTIVCHCRTDYSTRAGLRLQN
ncbi:uncharacterized protein LOC119985185 isoform X1 [Tripterygium wilfordii]|uniref:uncharacterized protein LOC119985185 isoform X1 n=1 Tax=Tripterygium wilfordii TaxID=458696 RepID=UPI0018F84EDD|nr:uncharacterized protein LOC119985185 isoform X1 [Tripterygium wilfordii]